MIGGIHVRSLINTPIMATFRESQNYIRSFELGIGVHEMQAERSLPDVEQWAPLVAWLESRGRTGTAGVEAAL